MIEQPFGYSPYVIAMRRARRNGGNGHSLVTTGPARQLFPTSKSKTLNLKHGGNGGRKSEGTEECLKDIVGLSSSRQARLCSLWQESP
jgi:hypothetical protein